MKKKKILRKWVQVLVGVIMILAVMIGAMDCESMILFVAKEIVCLAIVSIGFLTLKKYTNLFEE